MPAPCRNWRAVNCWRIGCPLDSGLPRIGGNSYAIEERAEHWRAKFLLLMGLTHFLGRAAMGE